MNDGNQFISRYGIPNKSTDAIWKRIARLVECWYPYIK